MKTEYFVFRNDGKIYWIENMPEEKQSNPEPLNEIEVSNRDLMLELTWHSNHVRPLQCNVERKDGKVVVTF